MIEKYLSVQDTMVSLAILGFIWIGLIKAYQFWKEGKFKKK